MKKLFIVFAMLISYLASAQTQVGRRPFEAEIGVNASYGLNHFDPFTGWYIAARYNYANIPFDLGMEYSNVSFYNKKKDNYYKNENIKVVSNYNFYGIKNFTPFVGMGAGMAWNEFHDEYYNGDSVGRYVKRSLILTPRVGFEVFDHVRFMVEYNLFPTFGGHYKDSHHLEFKLGIAFGGGKKN